MELVVDTFLLYIVNKHQCNLLTMCSFFNSIFTVTGNNNKMYSENMIGNRNFHSKLPIIVFQINSISFIESEEFRETSIEISHYKEENLNFYVQFSQYNISIVQRSDFFSISCLKIFGTLRSNKGRLLT